MRKLFTILLVLSLMAGLFAVDYSVYDKGVTVAPDGNSPTGYTATFIYDELDSYPGLGDIIKVELYSDCFMLFDAATGNPGVIDAAFGHSPYAYRAGLSPAGGNGGTTVYVEMTEFADGLWGVQMPLSSGAFVYNFRVTDIDGNSKARLDDPSNPTLVNSATGIKSLSSLVYVPYNPVTMGTGAYADRSVELPQADPAKQGTVETVGYTGEDGTLHGLAVYLPAGYDENRDEPYKVLYISHGTSGDVYGDELRWLNEGAVKNITDNLVAEGKAEPFVVVSMNNQQFSRGPGNQGPDWDFSPIEIDQIEYIMPYVEARYNICAEASGRAYAGLSMGGVTASNMLLYHPDLFSYYGVWSYANAEESMGRAGIADKAVQDSLLAYDGELNIMISAGIWDFGLESCSTFGAYLDEIGIASTFLLVPAAHDWENWQLTYAWAAENFLWK